MPVITDQYRLLYPGDGLMDSVTKYLLSVAAAAIISGILSSLIGKSSAVGSLIKLLCGLFLAVTVIAPLAQIRLDDFTNYLDGLSLEANAYTGEGKDIAAKETTAIIKSNLEAYILDKAESLGLDITVSVTLNNEYPYLPQSVTVTGNTSPYARQCLSTYIENDLAIPEDRQTWN